MLWEYLLNARPPLRDKIPLATRINWAVEIAEGLAHLHSKSVIWADAHFRNVLWVTDDLHIVLADFAYSIKDPDRFHFFTTMAPPVFAYPENYSGRPPTHVDIFGFGFMLFGVLADRFPWTENLMSGLLEAVETMNKYAKRQFDELDDPKLKEMLGPIQVLAKCS
ncbi:kinase-like domain-containing protein [Mycena rosella]|uniref:Kinase-like domain-containing protein n=1 Tax=Mycena rosella TaxID=1033263 RepID=A0AAD7GC92_MYCRO|nr:kinase-like domain-containing protein [Mycena rosella]